MSFDTAVFFCISNTVLYLLLAEQTAVSGHLSPTPLVAAYENASSSYGHFFRVPRVSAYKSFDCIDSRQEISSLVP